MRPTRSAQQAPAPAVMVHLYRGLMDRAITWRSRIDMPTNWAVVISGTSASFVLSDPTHHHAALLLTMVFCVSFWFIEARRYRYYDLWATWLRLLETDFYAPLLGQNILAVDQYWHKLLISDMIHPHFKISPLEALGGRLRHNYVAIFLFLLFVWLLKLLIHPLVPDRPMFETFVDDAALGPFGGQIVLLAVLGAYAVMLVLALTTVPRWSGKTELVTHDRTLRKLSLPIAQPVGRRWQRNRPRRRHGEAQD